MAAIARGEGQHAHDVASSLHHGGRRVVERRLDVDHPRPVPFERDARAGPVACPRSSTGTPTTRAPDRGQHAQRPGVGRLFDDHDVARARESVLNTSSIACCAPLVISRSSGSHGLRAAARMPAASELAQRRVSRGGHRSSAASARPRSLSVAAIARAKARPASTRAPGRSRRTRCPSADRWPGLVDRQEITDVRSLDRSRERRCQPSSVAASEPSSCSGVGRPCGSTRGRCPCRCGCPPSLPTRGAS